MTWCTRTTSRWSLLTCATTALGLLMLVSCALPAEVVPAAPAQPARIHASWTGCRSVGAVLDGEDPGTSKTSGPAETGSVPSGFVATTALLCGTGTRVSSNGDTVQVELERQADDISALLAYLDRPNQTSKETACAAMGWTPPWLFLRDAGGRWLAPAIPRDSCDFAVDLFTDAGPAYEQLKYHDRVVERGRVLETAAAKASGCAMGRKNTLAVEAGGAAHLPLTGADPFHGAVVRVCLYSVPASERASSVPGGKLVRGKVLDPAQRRKLVKALTGARPGASSCAAQASRFALLAPTQGDSSLSVELDGCRRILLDPGHGAGTRSLATADQGLTRSIVAVSR